MTGASIYVGGKQYHYDFIYFRPSRAIFDEMPACRYQLNGMRNYFSGTVIRDERLESLAMK